MRRITMSNEKALIVSADWWEMEDEKKPGVFMRGWSCWFVNDYRESADKSFGFKPSKVTITDEVAEQLRKIKLPAFCEMQYGSRPGAQGKATLTLTGFKVLGTLDIGTMAVEKFTEKKAA